VPYVSGLIKQARIDAGQGSQGALTTTERQELTQLRRDVKNLKMERDFLKKAAAFFARDNSNPLS
jgi:transposase